MLKSDPTSAYDYYQQAAKKADRQRLSLPQPREGGGRPRQGRRRAAALDSARKLDPKAADKYAELAQVGGAGTRAAEADEGGLAWF